MKSLIVLSLFVLSFGSVVMAEEVAGTCAGINQSSDLKTTDGDVKKPDSAVIESSAIDG